MPPKRKNPEEGQTTPSQPRSGRRSRTTKDDESTTIPIIKAETKPEPHPPKIQWDSNERWTDRLIEYLTNHLDARLKMFSDSVKDAKKESRKKVVGSKPKVEYYHEIAKAVFDVGGEEECGAYLMEPERYATSVLGRITYLQKTYTTYRKTMRNTGEGLKDEDESQSEVYRNQLEKIKASFPWWNTLHAWWSEHPKYAFQMVTNSMSGAGKMTCRPPMLSQGWIWKTPVPPHLTRLQGQPLHQSH
ncbi:uncharacterized protein EI90DRAFT_3018099 [Cantharellus anzutake]|uniref:uncharacterized protein n=1 Tax=Cantharellus anzutake TaxID=1750568 RepID=UPI00190881D6|nr:uncharacterized protein EI90DRAFT_3018099 [Cantharellus anzutake]KAF8327607.1 hypothetical protein EI90DRAFT_3018099 [Cantharellus anzutake]